jgi:hypothetical protein
MGQGPQPLALPKPMGQVPDVLRQPAIQPIAPSTPAAPEPVTVAKAITKANGKVKVTPPPPAPDDLEIPAFLRRNRDNTLPSAQAAAPMPAPAPTPAPTVTAEVPALSDAAREALFARAKPSRQMQAEVKKLGTIAPGSVEKMMAARASAKVGGVTEAQLRRNGFTTEQIAGLTKGNLKEIQAADFNAQQAADRGIVATPAPSVAEEAPLFSRTATSVKYQGKPLQMFGQDERLAGLDIPAMAAKITELRQAAGKPIKSAYGHTQGIMKYLTEKAATAVTLTNVTGISTKALTEHLASLHTQTEARAWRNQLMRLAPKSQKKDIAEALPDTLISRWWKNKP